MIPSLPQSINLSDKAVFKLFPLIVYISSHVKVVFHHLETQIASRTILFLNELRWVLRHIRASFSLLQVPHHTPRPQEDPVDDIPLLDLELPAPSPEPVNEVPTDALPAYKMDTILEIDGSENFTQNMQRSPKNEFLLSNRKSRGLLGDEEGIEVPKRVRIRMRSQSDNS